MGRVLGFFVCVFSLMTVLSTGVSASEYDWSEGTPVVHYQQDTVFEWTPYCPTYYQEVNVKGEWTRVCHFGSGPHHVGLTYSDNGQIRFVIADAFEDEMHRVEGVCMGIRNCLYARESDTLISRYYTSHGYLSVEVFKNASGRISSAYDPMSGKAQYTFDSTNPDFRFNDEKGRPLPIEAVGASNNGKWLGVEYRNHGIILINQETFEMRRVLAPGFRYGFSVDPTVEMAISNDGGTVAVMGERAGSSITRVTPECGDRVRPHMGELFRDDVIRCPLVNLDVASFVPQFHGVYNPHFDDSGGRLDFTVLSKTGVAKRVGVRAAGSGSVPMLAYLAIGDSFTSGEGETDSRHYLPRTDDELEKCHTSNRSYPFLLARLRDLSSVRNVACSGAKMTDIFARGGYLGQGRRLGPAGLSLSEGGIAAVQARALDSFHPGVTGQSRFVERYEPGLLTVGVGGNDAGLTTKLKVCAMPGECEWTSEAGRQKTAGEIQSLFGRFVEFYRKLTVLSPVSQIIAIGYPHAVDESGACDPVTATLFSGNELRFMNESMMYLNQVIERAARSVGVAFVDMSRVFAGHQLCSGSLTPAMNGLRTGDDAAVGILFPLRIIGNESFHPTPYGHELIAYELRRRYNQLTSGAGCLECPDTPPSGSSYWGEEKRITSRLGDFASPSTLTPHDSVIAITLPPQSLLAGSDVRVEIHSDVMVLGTLKADEQGGLSGSLTIPTGLEEGFHTIHLFGTSDSGEDVEVYQEITNEMSLPVDEVTNTHENDLAGKLDVSRSDKELGTIREQDGSSVLGATTSGDTKANWWVGWQILGAATLLVIGAALYLVTRKIKRNPS
jgi:lysophospholipase L1-like esterase